MWLHGCSAALWVQQVHRTGPGPPPWRDCAMAASRGRVCCHRLRDETGPVPQTACHKHRKDNEVRAQHFVQQASNRGQNERVEAALGRQARRRTLCLQGREGDGFACQAGACLQGSELYIGQQLTSQPGSSQATLARDPAKKLARARLATNQPMLR